MNSDGWIVAIGGGVIVGVIVLFIEYNFFQRRRQTQNATSNPKWADATKKAIKSLRDYGTYQIPDVELVGTTINKGTAILEIYEIYGRFSSFPERRRHFLATIDRTGDILELKQINPKEINVS